MTVPIQVLVLLQSVTETSEELRQAVRRLVPHAPQSTAAGDEEKAVDKMDNDDHEVAASSWATKELLSLVEMSPSPNVKWFGARYPPSRARTHTRSVDDGDGGVVLRPPGVCL
jgi:hypothetical protein